MKKLITTLVACWLGIVCLFGAGCYVQQVQPMKNVKGTYKLTTYTKTEKNKNESGTVVETKTDLVATDEIAAYLVVTGEETGYYAYQSNTVSAHLVEIAFSYEADEEETDKYGFVSYQALLPMEIEFTRLSITKNGLNFSRPVMYTTIKDTVLKQAGYSVKWTKENDATDLSYVFEQLGELPLPSAA